MIPQDQGVVAPVMARRSALAPVIEAASEGLRRVMTRRRRRLNLQQLIESRLEGPVFVVVTFTMIVRAAQMFSGGALIMSHLLGSHYPAFEIGTGLGLGFGSEMLMTIAGRSWRAWSNEVTDMEARPGMSKAARQAHVSRAKQNASWSRSVMFVGMGSSLFAGLSYLILNGNLTVWAVVTDLMAAAVVTTTVFYLGVLKEARSGQSEAEELIAELDESLNDAVQAAIRRFRDGTQTDKDEKLIAEHLSPGRKARFLRAVAKVNKGRVFTTTELRKRLGLGNDATKIRKLNKQINLLAQEPDNALEKAPDNKTWLIPARVVYEVWGDEIAQHDASLLVGTRTLVGEAV